MAWTDRYCIDGGAGLHDGTSEANAWSLAEAIAAAVGGDRINVKAATFANTTTSRTFGDGAGAATTTAPKWWRGYKTTIGDMDGRPTTTRVAGTDIPHITFTSGIVTISGVHQIFSSISFLGTATGSARLVGVTGSKCKFIRCRFENQDTNVSDWAIRASTDGLYFTECWFKATSSANNVAISEERIFWDGCVFIGGGNGLMLDAGAQAPACLDCVFDNNGDDAIEVPGNGSVIVLIDSPTIYSPGGHGINITGAVPCNILIRNPIFSDITGVGKVAVNVVSGSNVPHIVNPLFYNVTTEYGNVTEDLEWFRQDDSSSPFEDAGSHDFDLASGSNAKSNGAPGLFEGESYRSYADIGAVRHIDPAGGGGVIMPIGGTMRGGF